MLSTELRILFRDTGRVWWRLLPIIVGVYLIGWLGNELILRIAVIAGDVSPWLALALFAFSFVCTLAAAIVILTLAGQELGIRQLLPEGEREIDDRDTSLTRLLLITLLPFLAMYAAFGQVTEAANRLVVQQHVRYGFLSDQQTVHGVLYDLAAKHLGWLLALIVGIYVLRRLLDYVAERIGLRILSFLVDVRGGQGGRGSHRSKTVEIGCSADQQASPLRELLIRRDYGQPRLPGLH